MHQISPARRLTIAAAAIVCVAVICGVYLGLETAWVSARADLDDPGYVLKAPLRQFFTASLIAAVAAGVAGLPALVPVLRRAPLLRTFTMTLGLLMVATGFIGMLIVLPAAATLSGSGGLNPDFGHVLTWDNFTGPLWLFLLSGAIPCMLAFLAGPRPRTLANSLLLAVSAAPAAWYIAMALVDRWQDITAP